MTRAVVLTLMLVGATPDLLEGQLTRSDSLRVFSIVVDQATERVGNVALTTRVRCYASECTGPSGLPGWIAEWGVADGRVMAVGDGRFGVSEGECRFFDAPEARYALTLSRIAVASDSSVEVDWSRTEIASQPFPLWGEWRFTTRVVRIDGGGWTHADTRRTMVVDGFCSSRADSAASVDPGR